jgi:prepilin-type N-terminal cleavage/methylation domain-containing protein
MKMKKNDGFTLIELMIVLAILAVVAVLAVAILVPPIAGLFPFGEYSTVTAKVDRLYVDYSGGKDSQSSHYMVGTDAGVFEVDNSLWLWMWDADKRYAQIKEGHTYRFRVKGSEMINMLFQSYPGIVAVERVE